MAIMRATVITALLMSAVLLCGCDPLRKLAGRPTGADIAAKRAELAAARIQAGNDAVPAADSCSASGGEKEELSADDETFDGKTMTLARVGGLAGEELEGRLHIIVGSFSEAANARKMCDRVRSAGYDSRVIPFRNGLNAVSAGHADRYSELNPLMARLREEAFCPDDVWVLINK